MTPYLKNKKNRFLIPSIICLFLFYMLFINIVRVNEITLNYDIFSGQVSCDKNPGIKITAPWVLVSNIDIRPTRVCIDCSCNNITCELVSFNHIGYEEFIQREGWSYYWWKNRISFNMGNNSEWRGFENILRGYAFDNTEYSFIIHENGSI